MFEEADEEFLPIAKDLFEKHKDNLNLLVDPSMVMFLRSDGRRKAFAYCKVVRDEYELLTDKKFFIVIVDKYFDRLKTDKEKRYVILHEMKHLFVDDNERYRLLDHNLKEFQELLQNPAWNLELVTDEKEEVVDSKGGTKIGLDFDFNNREVMKELKKKIKEEESKVE
jgi:hypothetical protein